MSHIRVYYIDTDEIPGFFHLLKNNIFIDAVKILFLTFTCEDIGVAMVTNMSSQLQESFPLSRAAGSFEISITKWLRSTKTVQLPVSFFIVFISLLITLYLSFITFSWQAFCDKWPFWLFFMRKFHQYL